MASFDFFSPFMGAAILVKDPPGRYPLTYAEGPLSKSLISAASHVNGTIGGLETTGGNVITDILPFLSSLTVELNLAYMPKITAVLTPPFREAIAILNSPLVEYGINSIEAQFGYATGKDGPVLSPKLAGLMLQPDISIGTDISITLYAQGIGGFSATNQSSNVSSTKKTRYQVIKELITGPDKKNPRSLDLDIEKVKPGTPEFKLLAEDQIVPTQGGTADWFYIWKLVTESGCWMQEVNGTLFIFPVDGAFSKTPKIDLRLYDMASGPDGQFGPAVGTYPILQVSSPTKAMYIGGIRGLVLRGVDPDTRKILTKKIDDTTEKPARLGPNTPKGAPAAPAETSETPGTNPDDMSGFEFFPGNPTTTAQAQAEFKNIANSMGITLEVETLGIPDILPADCVSVNGLGLRYDGNYCVHVITHVLSSSGYTTRLKLISNTQGFLKSFKAALAPANTQIADPSASGSTTKDPKAG